MNMAYAMGTSPAGSSPQGSGSMLGQVLAQLVPLVVLGVIVVLIVYQVRKNRAHKSASRTIPTCHTCNISYTHGEKFCKKCGDPL